MNEITPPPDGWMLLFVVFALFVLFSRMFGDRFWEAVKIIGIVVIVAFRLAAIRWNWTLPAVREVRGNNRV